LSGDELDRLQRTVPGFYEFVSDWLGGAVTRHSSRLAARPADATTPQAKISTSGPSAEVPLNWNKWVRQIHRWVSIVFTVTVIANFVALGQGGGMPPPWITYSPLPPLALLLFTGLYLFVLPYATRWRGPRGQ
jgi:hypothetical protein